MEAGRERLKRMLEQAPDPFLGRTALAGAVVQAQANERIGDGDDARALAAVLSLALSAELGRGNQPLIDLRTAELLAALCTVADDGDEPAAMAVNDSAPSLPPAVVVMAGACQRIQRGEA